MGFKPTLWAAAALAPLTDSRMLIDEVNREYDKDAKNGEAVEIPVLGSLTIQDGQNTDTGDGTVIGEGSTKILIDQETFATVTVKDVDQLQSNVNKVQSYASKIATDIKSEGMTLNLTKYMATNAAAANKVQFTELVSGATTLTFAVLKAIKKKMDKAKIPRTGRFLLVDADYESALFDVVDDEGNKVFINKQYTAVNSFDDGEITRGMGFTVRPTEMMPKLKADGTISATEGENIKSCIIAYQKDCVAAVVQKAVTFKDYPNKTKRATDIVGSTIWGRKVIRDLGIICVRQNT